MGGVGSGRRKRSFGWDEKVPYYYTAYFRKGGIFSARQLCTKETGKAPHKLGYDINVASDCQRMADDMDAEFVGFMRGACDMDQINELSWPIRVEGGKQ